ncbi:hypothetical protein GCM10011584_06810 [Nocardioides phosphati]|uniref:DUF952 domain-containing protein n=1 Tax=Nocardioides phosphati TaxID=1867775 RepID=A0ABQ2N622_9ACTN|nr:DUF952 domain-containing protein [Nocardioides phosphati]GGO85864.1 hypothetical protein GCM10011584_06810 [Nocardioides phosphati]
MRIFHIAERSRWEAAKLAGAYAWSTRGRTLEQEGFIHCSREDQWQAIRELVYADAREPLVLLEIDTDKLTAPWSEDPVEDDTYPHIHGALNPAAVVGVRPLASTAEPSESFFRLFLGEALFRMLAAIVVMAAAVAVAALVEHQTGSAGAALAGLAATVVLGTVLAAVAYRRRNARAADRP